MSILKIARMGHPVLLQKAKAVDDPTRPEIRQLVADMVETMIDANGAGLAAPQVHVPLRVVVFQAPPERVPVEVEAQDGAAEEAFDHTAPLTVLINPEIEVLTEDRAYGWEGCLSVPEFYEDVERPDRCVIDFLDYEGNPQTLEADGLLAVCIQHEMDHLNGVLFIDHLSRLKRERILKKLKREKAAAEAAA